MGLVIGTRQYKSDMYVVLTLVKKSHDMKIWIDMLF